MAQTAVKFDASRTDILVRRVTLASRYRSLRASELRECAHSLKRALTRLLDTYLLARSPDWLTCDFMQQSGEESGAMPFYFSWGDTFVAILGEFWPWQIAQIRAYASELFERRPQDVDLERMHGIRASVIPFEMFGYGLVLVLRDDLWTLEVADFPPHAEPGQRIRKARRQREQSECKGAREQGRVAVSKTGKRASSEGAKRRRKPKREDAARVISTLKNALQDKLRPISLKLYNINEAAYRRLGRLRHKAAVFAQDMRGTFPASPLTAHQRLLHWMTPSREDCRDANIAGWAHDWLPPGFQWERRLFFANFLPMWLDTIAPIEPTFVRGGRSVFGEHGIEGECVS